MKAIIFILGMLISAYATLRLVKKHAQSKEVKFLILAIITCLLTTVFAALTMVAVYGII